MDLEKQSGGFDTKDIRTSSDHNLSSTHTSTTVSSFTATPGEAHVTNIRQSNNILRRLRNFETWVDSRANFEAMGVERIPEHMRKPPQIVNVCKPSINQSINHISTCSLIKILE